MLLQMALFHSFLWLNNIRVCVCLWLNNIPVCVCVYVFLLVILPCEIPKLPTDPLVRGFPAVWKLLLLHDRSPSLTLVSLFVFYILSYLF